MANLIVRSRKAVPILIVLALVLSAAACERGNREKALLYMRDFQVSLEAVQDAEIAAHQQNFVSDSDHATFQGYVVRIATYGKAANNAIARSNQDTLVQIDAALGEIDELQTAGLLAVKNQQTRASLSALLLTVRTILTSVKVELQ